MRTGFKPLNFKPTLSRSHQMSFEFDAIFALQTIQPTRNISKTFTCDIKGIEGVGLIVWQWDHEEYLKMHAENIEQMQSKVQFEVECDLRGFYKCRRTTGSIYTRDYK